MNEDLRNLLTSWEVEEEYIQNFERAKIKKISTMLLLDETAIAKLFPEDGPRVEFLSYFKELTSKNSGTNDCNTSTSTGETSRSPIADGPQAIGLREPVSPQSSQECEATPEENHLSRADLMETTDVEFINVDKLPESGDMRCDTALYMLLSRESGVTGKLIIAYFKEHKTLNDNHRNQLADIIINNYLSEDLDRSFSAYTEAKLVNEVLEVFPTESKIYWGGTPNIKREFAAGRGKLLNKYYTLRRKLIIHNLIPKSGRSKNNSSGVREEAGTTENNEEINVALMFLQNTRSGPDIVTNWEKTSRARYNALLRENTSVQDYMDTFPALKEPGGFSLICVDFKVLFSHSDMKLFTEWPRLSAFIYKFLTAAEKEEIEESFTKSAKHMRTILFFNKLFPVVTAVKKGKEQWRPTRVESKEGLMLFVKNVGDIQTALRVRKTKYEKYGLGLGPQAIGVGADEDSITHSYFCINSIVYEVENPLKAIDVVFKATHVMDTPYHAECRREWTFLQKAIYEIHSRDDPKSLDTKTRAKIDEFIAFKSNLLRE